MTNFIGKHRERAGLPLAQLTIRSGLIVDDLRDFEDGVEWPWEIRRRPIAAVLGVAVEDLLPKRNAGMAGR